MILTADGIDVVAEAATGADAVDAVRRTRPDVVLMDIRMPEMDGLETSRPILATGADQPPRVIILTTFDLDWYVYAALSAGQRLPAQGRDTGASGGWRTPGPD